MFSNNKSNQTTRKRITNVVSTILLTVVLLSFTSCSLNSLKSKPDTKTTVSSEGVSTVSPEKKDISTIVSGIATLQAAKTTGVFYKDITGPLKKVLVNLGDNVELNQNIMEISVPDFEKKIKDQEQNMQKWPVKQKQLTENIEAADRQIRTTEMEVERIQKKINDYNNDSVDSAERQQKQAEIELDKAQKVYKVESNYSNKNALEKARLVYDQAVSNYESTQKAKENENYDNIQSLEKAQLAYEQALSSYKSAKLAKELSGMDYQIELRELTELKAKAATSILKAPAKGTIVALEKLSEGEVIYANKILVKIADPKNFVLQVTSGDAKTFQNVKQAVLQLNNEKYNVEVYVPQPGDQLDQVGQDTKTKNKFYISFINGKLPNINLTDSYEVKLEVGKKAVLTLPRSVFTEDNGKTMVDILKGDKIEVVEVVKGLEKDDFIEVISGINRDDKVVLK